MESTHLRSLITDWQTELRTHSLTTPAVLRGNSQKLRRDFTGHHHVVTGSRRDETFRPWCESGMNVNVNDQGPWGVSVGRNGSPGSWLQLVGSI